MFGPSVFGLTFSELFSSVFVRAASGRIMFWLFGLRVDLETIINTSIRCSDASDSLNKGATSVIAARPQRFLFGTPFELKQL